MNRGLSKASSILKFHKGVFDGYTGKRIPSMVAPITDAKDEVVGIHITHLGRDGDRWVKSTIVKAAKKMRKLSQTISGGSIRMFKMDAENLGISEGIETALAVKEHTGVTCCPS